MGKPKYVPPAIRRAVIEEYKRDPRPCAVAARFGLHHRRVRTWLQEAGLIKPSSALSVESSTPGLRGGYMTMARPDDGDDEVNKEDIRMAEEFAEMAKGELTDGEIKDLYREAERAYLFALLNPARVSKTDSKDAAAVAKAVREAIGRINEQERALKTPEEIEEEHPGLKAWERVMKRLLAETHPADEDWMREEDC